MDEREFKNFMNRARIIGGDYAAGYTRGLQRHYHGETFEPEEGHEKWMSLGLDGDKRIEMGNGYRDGNDGKPPVGLDRGRPRFEDEPQKRRNISLSDAHADKARRIGGGNISEGIRIALDAYESR